MNYRYIKKLCRREKKLKHSELSKIFHEVLNLPHFIVYGEFGPRFPLEEIDASLYMAKGYGERYNLNCFDSYSIGGSKENPLIYIPFFVKDGNFYAILSLSLIELAETMIRHGIRFSLRWQLDYSDIMREYRIYLYKDLKKDGLRPVFKRFYTRNHVDCEEMVDRYTTEAIIEYNRTKYLKYGNGFNKKHIRSTSKRKKLTCIHV